MIRILGLIVIGLSIVFLVQGIRMLSESGRYNDHNVEGADEKLYAHIKNRDLKTVGKHKLKKGLSGLILGIVIVIIGFIFPF